MTKKAIIFVVLSAIILGGISGWLFDRYLVPKLNSVQWLVKYHLAPDPGKVIINTRQEIRVNEGTDSIAAIQKVVPWVVGLISGTNPTDSRILANGLVLTSDGLVATTRSAVTALGTGPYNLKMLDGEVFKANLVALDPESDLAFLKTDHKNMATASLGFPKDLQLGQRIIGLSASLDQFESTDVISGLTTELRNFDATKVVASERLNRTFSVDGLSSLPDGSAVFSLDGNVQGIYSHNGIITSDVLRSAMNSYFNSGKIVRNNFGVYYQYIPEAVASVYDVQQGIQLKKPDVKTAAVVAQSPAATAGLAEGDIIYKVNGTQINFDNSFEELLAKFTPGQTVVLSVERGKTLLTINVALGSKQ